MDQNEKKSTYPNKEQRIKVLMLTWEYPPCTVGGLARHVEGLAFHLINAGVDVDVITVKAFHIPSFEVKDGVNVHRVQPLNEKDSQFLNWIGGLNFAIVSKGLELAEQNKYEIIHAHDWLVAEAGLMLKKQLKIPLISTIHATEIGRNNGIYTEIQQFIHEKEAKLITNCEQIIVCSDFMKKEVMNFTQKNKKNITVIPNGVSLEHHLKKDDTEYHPILIKEKRKMIFSIGRLVREKGFDLIITAAAKLNRNDFCIVIAGVGPMQLELEQLIRDYNLQNIVHLIGFIPDSVKNQFFNRCQMAIFPSRYEPFGIVALEAMKFSCPIVVAKTGGLAEIFTHNHTAYFFEPNNVNELIEQISYIDGHPKEAKQVADNGKNLLKKQFKWKNIAERTKVIYEQVLFN